jgi:hypothetical protein
LTDNNVLTAGTEATFVGFNQMQRLVTSKTNVVDVIDVTVCRPLTL